MPSTTAAAKTRVSLVERINKTRSRKALVALLAEAKAGRFPATNPKTLRRRKRALQARLQKFAAKTK